MAATRMLINLSGNGFVSEMTLVTIAVLSCCSELRHWLQKRVAKTA
jgi:hypothetical protein